MAKPLLKLKRSIKRLLKIKEDIDPVAVRRPAKLLIKYLMALAAVAMIALLYPPSDLFGPLDVPREGEIAPENIIADIPFDLLKSDAQLAEERRVALQSTPVYFTYDETVVDSSRQDLRRFLAIADSLRNGEGAEAADIALGRLKIEFPTIPEEWLAKFMQSRPPRRIGAVLDSILVADIYSSGVIDNIAGLVLLNFNSAIMRKPLHDLTLVRAELVDRQRAYNILLDRLNLLAPRMDIDVDTYYEIVRHFVVPNAVLDNKTTGTARDSTAAAISTIERKVTSGDLLVRRGVLVDAETARLLKTYAGQVRAEAAARGWYQEMLPVAARLILVAAIILLLYLFLYHFAPEVFWSNNKILALLLIIGMELFLVNIIGARLIHSVYLLPIAVLSILVTILFDSRLGVVITLLMALLLGILNRFNFTITLITALAGTIACFSAGEIRRRSEFYRIILFLSLAYTVIIFVIESLRLSPAAAILTYCGYGLANGFISPMLTVGILPIFESLFGFTTDVTLLELADLNQPLLKRMSLQAPGTYHHSIVLGTLAEAAAKAIGANPLLAQVGAYYHDIGKMEIPEYFVENQLGLKSKHESLNPTMSALVLASHVKKGRKLGEEAGLPDAVLRFVEEHHGTSVMTYFFSKAKEMGLPLDSDEEFRYPGPKPQSKETAIVMLADSTEAASRTLDNPTPARIRNLIQKLINDKFSSGELTDSALTLKDLNDIREAFMSILIGVFHQRIAYPKKEAEGARS
jgi:cyclic-di-AMP phosphodiesterase PgpH